MRTTISVEDAAIVLGAGRHTAYREVRNGGLGAIRVNRRWLVPVAPLAARLGVEPDELLARLDEAKRLGAKAA
jgi:excisionase family DNA binding protein